MHAVPKPFMVIGGKNFLFSHIVTLLLVFIFLGSFSLILANYWREQKLLSLEGRNLYTAEAVITNIAPKEVPEILSKLNPRVRVFTDLDDTGALRALYANNNDISFLPVHDIKTLDAIEGGAIAGSQIPVTKVNSNSYVNFEGRLYPKIASLGTTKSSLLMNDSIIIDKNLFISKGIAGTVIFDNETNISDKLKEINPTIRTKAIPFNSSDKTNLDIISPTLTLIGIITIIFSSLFAGSALGESEQKKIKIFHLLGISKQKIYLQYFSSLISAWLISFLTVFTISYLLKSNTLLNLLSAAMSFILILSATSYFIRIRI